MSTQLLSHYTLDWFLTNTKEIKASSNKYSISILKNERKFKRGNLQARQKQKITIYTISQKITNDYSFHKMITQNLWVFYGLGSEFLDKLS